MARAKRVAIVQSNYVPWRGYFDLMASVDEFVLLDDAQYTRRDWRNRNRIKAPQGTRWLTIPVQVSGRYTQTIAQTRIADERWAARHWDILRASYGRAAGFSALGPFVEELYASAPAQSLSQVNEHFLAAIAPLLGIRTPLTRSCDYAPQGSRTARLVDICVKAGAGEYVSGPAARAYLDEAAFEREGIGVTWFSYPEYPHYEQPHPPFDPRVSILDVLLCCGARAADVVFAAHGAPR